MSVFQVEEPHRVCRTKTRNEIWSGTGTHMGKKEKAEKSYCRKHKLQTQKHNKSNYSLFSLNITKLPLESISKIDTYFVINNTVAL